MNIWILNHYAHPPDTPGGTRHFDLGRELVRGGHRVTVFASSFHHYIHRETRLQPGEKWRVEEVEGVCFVWIRTPPYTGNDWRRVRNMLAFMLMALRLGRRLPRIVPDIGKPDVVIGSSVHLLAVLAAYRVARRHRARFVMEVRDLWPRTLVDMARLSTRSPVVKLLEVLERFLYFRADRIVILGPQMRDHITARGGDPGKTVWIPNGVDLSRSGEPGPSACESAKGLRVLYVGAHGQANALDVLVKAAKLVQDSGFDSFSLVLVGDGPKKPELMALARNLGLRNTEFRESVPKGTVPTILREAGALVVVLDPSFSSYGGSLNKLSDYMAAAKPIVFAGAPANNPVKDAVCGLTVPPRDPQALADALVQLAQMSREEREAMGKRGRAYVEEHHDIRKLAEKLESVLSEVVHGP